MTQLCTREHGKVLLMFLFLIDVFGPLSCCVRQKRTLLTDAFVTYNETMQIIS